MDFLEKHNPQKHKKENIMTNRTSKATFLLVVLVLAWLCALFYACNDNNDPYAAKNFVGKYDKNIVRSIEVYDYVNENNQRINFCDVAELEEFGYYLFSASGEKCFFEMSIDENIISAYKNVLNMLGSSVMFSEDTIEFIDSRVKRNFSNYIPYVDLGFVRFFTESNTKDNITIDIYDYESNDRILMIHYDSILETSNGENYSYKIMIEYRNY